MSPSQRDYRSPGEGPRGPAQAFLNLVGPPTRNRGSVGPLQHQHLLIPPSDFNHRLALYFNVLNYFLLIVKTIFQETFAEVSDWYQGSGLGRGAMGLISARHARWEPLGAGPTGAMNTDRH
jgi:hypothetical protein